MTGASTLSPILFIDELMFRPLAGFVNLVTVGMLSAPRPAQGCIPFKKYADAINSRRTARYMRPRSPKTSIRLEQTAPFPPAFSGLSTRRHRVGASNQRRRTTLNSDIR